MVDDSLKVFILEYYIRRIWTWLEFFGIATAIVGAVALYDQIDLLDPIRSNVSLMRLRWWSLLLFSITAGSVLAALITAWLAEKGVTARIASIPISNPPAKNDADLQAAVTGAVLSRLRAVEAAVWMLAVIPAFCGVILFAMGRPVRIMLLYLGITIVSAMIFMPSLDKTERAIERCLEKSRARPSPEE